MWEERRAIAGFASDLGRHGSGRVMAVNLALGFFPSALLGLAIHDIIARVLFAPLYVGWGLIAGAVGILVVERSAKRSRVADLASIRWKAALGVGMAQCLSLFPGVSRSAATILGGMAAGLTRRTATEFSFLLAIPTMLGASVYELFRWRHTLGAGDLPLFAVGFATAFVSGLAAVRFLLRYVATHDFRPFAYYRILIGAAVLWVLWRL